MDVTRRKYEVRDRQVAAIMKLLEILATHIKSVNVICAMSGREFSEEEVYFLNDQEASEDVS